MPLSDYWSDLWTQFQPRPSLESAPYEVLLSWYPAEQKTVFEEFVRRLSPLVFHASVDFCKRRGVKEEALQQRAKELKTSTFEDFFPEMGAGQPEMVLCRFATTLRSVLDDEAFRRIERFYYWHLPLYHLRNRDQRRCLEAMFASGLSATPQQISEQFHLPTAQVEELLRAGNRELERIIR